MQRKDLLIKRINDLGSVLSKRDEVLALLALGSIGVERERLDDVSDLDFFVVVKKGFKEKYILDLEWLNETHLLGYAFKNTKDGYKIMFTDGIYGEFAVFDETEVKNLHQPEGKIIWQQENYDSSLLIQSKGPKPKLYQDDIAFALNEALTNLYVGLCRVYRGERLSGYRFIETYAFNNIISLLHHYESNELKNPDLYNLERRFEQHYPNFSMSLPSYLMGYEDITLSAMNLFNFIKSHMDIPKIMETEIMSLIHKIDTSKV